MDFSTTEITSKKVRDNNVDFFDHRNYIKKISENKVFFDQ